MFLVSAYSVLTNNGPKISGSNIQKIGNFIVTIMHKAYSHVVLIVALWLEIIWMDAYWKTELKGRSENGEFIFYPIFISYLSQCSYLVSQFLKLRNVIIILLFSYKFLLDSVTPTEI